MACSSCRCEVNHLYWHEGRGFCLPCWEALVFTEDNSPSCEYCSKRATDFEEIYPQFGDQPDYIFVCRECSEDRDNIPEYVEYTYWCSDCNRRVHIDPNYPNADLGLDPEGNADYICKRCLRDYHRSWGLTKSELEAVQAEIITIDDLLIDEDDLPDGYQNRIIDRRPHTGDQTGELMRMLYTYVEEENCALTLLGPSYEPTEYVLFRV